MYRVEIVLGMKYQSIVSLLYCRVDVRVQIEVTIVSLAVPRGLPVQIALDRKRKEQLLISRETNGTFFFSNGCCTGRQI